jgi:methionyl aminopeptidase
LCISVNNEVIHGIPSKNRKIKEGDIVSLDGGIVLDGFFSDCAKTIPIGNVSKEAQDLMEITKRALDAGIEACKFGSRIHDISRAVSGVINKKYGIVTDYCGHGVGLAVHEDPAVPNDLVGGSNPRLQEGMVLAIEPMINLGTGDVEVLDDDWTVVTCDGKISSHQEHTVVVFRDHTEILTII